MGENVISWNIANWITVVLMVALGFTILAWLTQFYKARTNTNQSS